jgi:tetratricopeptide (TPR) repeat protein
MMGQKPDAKLTPEIARELCQRTGSTAVINGSLAQIGTQYLLTLKAANCSSGESLASTEAQASDKNHVLDALGKTASEIRSKMGESLSTVQKFDTPLEQATTPSLEALKAFSSGRKLSATAGDMAAFPFFKRATELDPNFALAYVWLGIASTDLGEPNIASDYTRKAYELRDRTSEPEKYFITATFHGKVTGNMEKAEQSCRLWIQAYPRSELPHDYLSGAIYRVIGQYQKGVEEGREAVRLNPDFAPSYALLMFNLIALNRLDEAKATYGQALGRRLNHPFFSFALYGIAFLHNDVADMAQQVASSAGKSGVEDGFLDNITEARHRIDSALRLSRGRRVQSGVALAHAFMADSIRAQSLANDLDKSFPENTIVQFNYLPTLRAQFALTRNDPSRAIDVLQAAAPYELGDYGSYALYPVFVRGQAYIEAHKGIEAAAEFQKIFDHRGVVLNEPIGALAHLQIGRAYTLQGDTAKAKAAYQDFLTLWKDADPDIPVLVAAKKEYAKLQ